MNKGAFIEKWIGMFRQPARRLSKRHYSVCIYKPDRIGDFVLALGAIRKLIDRFGEKNCVLVISPLVRELADMEFPESPKVEVTSFGDPYSIKTIFHVLHRRWVLGGMVFDQLVCLRHQRVRMQNFLLYCIRARRSLGLINHKHYHLGDSIEYSFSNRDTYPTQHESGVCLEMEAHRIVVQRTIETEVVSAEIIPTFRYLQAKAQGYILVSPFASMPIRDYPEDALISVLVSMYHVFSLPVRISFSIQQRERAEKLAKRLSLEGVLVESLQSTTIQEYLVFVSHATCALTVESATAHVATTLDIPTVILLGGGHYMQYGPWNRSDKQRWITHPVLCAECNWNCTEPEPYCITRIDVDDIVKAIRLAVEGGPCKIGGAI